jgi:hypothetical protein
VKYYNLPRSMTGNGGKLYYLFENADDWGMAQMTLFYPHES